MAVSFEEILNFAIQLLDLICQSSLILVGNMFSEITPHALMHLNVLIVNMTLLLFVDSELNKPKDSPKQL